MYTHQQSHNAIMLSEVSAINLALLLRHTHITATSTLKGQNERKVTAKSDAISCQANDV